MDYLLGDYTKAKKILSWEPKHNLDQLIEIMVNFELNDQNA